MATFIDRQIEVQEIESENNMLKTSTDIPSGKNETISSTALPTDAKLFDQRNATRPILPTPKNKKGILVSANTKKVEFETEKFSLKEATLFKELCQSFVLRPRSVNRLINVFKIVKDIWRRKGKKMELKVTYNFLLLLVLAACEKNCMAIQKFFEFVHFNGISKNSFKRIFWMILTLS